MAIFLWQHNNQFLTGKYLNIKLQNLYFFSPINVQKHFHMINTICIELLCIIHHVMQWTYHAPDRTGLCGVLF